MPDSNTAFVDQTLTCSDCKNQFVLTAGEQAWFAEKALRAPKRCKGCRDQRRTQKPENSNTAPAQTASIPEWRPPTPRPPHWDNGMQQNPGPLIKATEPGTWSHKQKKTRLEDEDDFRPRKKSKRRRDDYDDYDD